MENEDDFDVVVYALQNFYDYLAAADRDQTEVMCGMTLMQQLRAEQRIELQEAIKVWKKYKHENTIYRRHSH